MRRNFPECDERTDWPQSGCFGSAGIAVQGYALFVLQIVDLIAVFVVYLGLNSNYLLV